jgi:hypothetical protein
MLKGAIEQLQTEIKRLSESNSQKDKELILQTQQLHQ